MVFLVCLGLSIITGFLSNKLLPEAKNDEEEDTRKVLILIFALAWPLGFLVLFLRIGFLIWTHLENKYGS